MRRTLMETPRCTVPSTATIPISCLCFFNTEPTPAKQTPTAGRPMNMRKRCPKERLPKESGKCSARTELRIDEDRGDVQTSSLSPAPPAPPARRSPRVARGPRGGAAPLCHATGAKPLRGKPMRTLDSAPHPPAAGGPPGLAAWVSRSGPPTSARPARIRARCIRSRPR